MVTSTSTSTVYLSPTASIIATLSSDVSVTVPVTETVPSTITTTAATITSIDVVATNTVTVDATSTVTVQPACTPGYNFVVTSGTFTGEYIVNGPPNPNTPALDYVRFRTATSAPTKYLIREGGGVYDENMYSWVSQDATSAYYVLQTLDSQLAKLLCSIDSSTRGGVPGSVGILACTLGGKPIKLTSRPETPGYLIQEKNASVPGSPANLAVVPVC